MSKVWNSDCRPSHMNKLQASLGAYSYLEDGARTPEAACAARCNSGVRSSSPPADARIEDGRSRAIIPAYGTFHEHPQPSTKSN